jgi:hypothetical protein
MCNRWGWLWKGKGLSNKAPSPSREVLGGVEKCGGCARDFPGYEQVLADKNKPRTLMKRTRLVKKIQLTVPYASL